MPENKTVLVEVLQGTQVFTGGWSCTSDCASAGSCGSTTNYEEVTKQMAEDFAKLYDKKVEVKYVDVDKEGLDKYPIMTRVLQMGYSYPVVFVDGQPRFAGAIMIPEIKSIIDEVLNKTDA